MNRYVALYCRLSPRPDGTYEGVERQEKWGREYAARTWPDLPVQVFADRGISGATEDREGLRCLNEAVERGEVAHLWTVEMYRLNREERHWFGLAARLDAAGVQEVHTDRDGIVRVLDEVAGIKAVIGAGERRRMIRRINDTLAEIAAAGSPSGSRPFGYVHGTNDRGERTYLVVPEQAEAIRDAAQKVLAGWSLASIAADLGKRGICGGHRVKVTVTGQRWYKDGRNGALAVDAKGAPVTRESVLGPGAVRTMVTNPTVAGHRVHQGRIVGRGQWEPILDEDTWKACKAKLEQPRRVKRSDGGEYPVGASHTGSPTGRKYVLTGGIAVCGVCEAPLTGSMKQLRRRRKGEDKSQVYATVPYLLCTPNRGGKGCVGIMLENTEHHVVDRLFAELDRPEFLQAIAEDSHNAERQRIEKALDAINGPGGQREQLAALWAQPGELTMAEWQTARQSLSEQERALRAELAALPPPVVGIDISTAREAWPGMTLDERRELIRLFVERVTIQRATPGTKGFDENRVQITWRSR